MGGVTGICKYMERGDFHSPKENRRGQFPQYPPLLTGKDDVMKLVSDVYPMREYNVLGFSSSRQILPGTHIDRHMDR